jgi:hypothetical protein
VRVSRHSACELRAWAYKNDGRGNRLKLVIDWYDSTHQVIGSAASPELTQDSAAWVELSTGIVPAPAGTEFARLSLWILGYGGSCCWDDIGFNDYVGIADEPRTLTPQLAIPTIVRGILVLNSSFDIRNSSLLDASGRRALDLRPGANDVSRLAPGVYFVREAAGLHKLVKTR